MNANQMRAARAMLGWTVRELAAKADVTPNTVSRLENGGDGKASTLQAVQDVLEKAGIVFTPKNGNGPGVAVRKDFDEQAK